MTQRETRPHEDANSRAASLIAQALSEMHQSAAAQVAEARQELSASSAVLQNLARGIETHLSEERQQHLVLANQLSSLTGSLDRLVTHLQGLSTLMADLLERLAEAPSTAPAASAPSPPAAAAAEPMFQPGGEGVSVTIGGISGFQNLMEIQKALTSLEQVTHASVERFQEGDSRILLVLSAPVSAAGLVDALSSHTGQAVTIEDSKPDLARLKLKIVPRS